MTDIIERTFYWLDVYNVIIDTEGINKREELNNLKGKDWIVRNGTSNLVVRKDVSDQTVIYPVTSAVVAKAKISKVALSVVIYLSN